MEKIGFYNEKDALGYIYDNYPEAKVTSTSVDSSSVSWSRLFNSKIDSYSGEVSAYLVESDDETLIVAYWE